jgi:methylase of polypeptide subunit release factors
MLALEHGHDQRPALDELLLGAGLGSIARFNDYAGQARVSTARRVARSNH